MKVLRKTKNKADLEEYFQKRSILFVNILENAIRSLGIKANEHSQENYDLKYPVEIAIKKFEQHPSINLIKKNITGNENFPFSPVDHENISKEIINLDNKKK